VAEKAGVALGLATYHFTDKITLVAAALERLGIALDVAD
jgi:AcrR family transcriptional regulator